jgi:hypothetical protein
MMEAIPDRKKIEVKKSLTNYQIIEKQKVVTFHEI